VKGRGKKGRRVCKPGDPALVALRIRKKRIVCPLCISHEEEGWSFSPTSSGKKGRRLIDGLKECQPVQKRQGGEPTHKAEGPPRTAKEGEKSCRVNREIIRGNYDRIGEKKEGDRVCTF